MKPGRRTLAWTGAALALAAVFAAYQQPALVVHIATQVWSCF